MIKRMIAAARLDTAIYEEVEADSSAILQAMAVVVLVALATGIGTLRTGGLVGLVVGIPVSIGLCALWAWITHLIGTTILKTAETAANWGQLARTLGFAQSPGILKVVGFIPGIGVAIVGFIPYSLVSYIIYSLIYQ